MFLRVNTITDDRFIPRRMPVNYDSSPSRAPMNYRPIINQTDNLKFVNMAKVRYLHRNYADTLRDTLMPLNTRVLNFFPPKEFSKTPTLPTMQFFQCKKRKKPVIGCPEKMLDMPCFDRCVHHNVADWSSRNYLATIFKGEIHMWHPNQSSNSNSKSNGRIINCIKWHPDGIYIACGLTKNLVGVWNTKLQKFLAQEPCIPYHKCEIMSIAWLRGDLLLTGCDHGQLSVRSFCLRTLHWNDSQHSGAIITIVVSADQQFCATSGLDSKVVIWKLFHNNISVLECFHVLELTSPSKALEWHPWESILVIGIQDYCILYKVNLMKMFCFKTKMKGNTSALTFNPISAELVIGYSSLNKNGTQLDFFIAVVNNLGQTVEELYIHQEEILYLLWDSKGQKLASLGSDENLYIWDFFVDDLKKKQISTSLKSRSKIFGSTIR